MAMANEDQNISVRLTRKQWHFITFAIEEVADTPFIQQLAKDALDEAKMKITWALIEGYEKLTTTENN